jgi:hypothetical protein
MPNEFSALFDPKVSTFIPLMADGKDATEVIRVPVGNVDDVAQVELGTAFVILLVFSYILRVSYKTAQRVSLDIPANKIE